MEILVNFSLGVLGISLYTIWKAKDYIFNKDFVLFTMVSENWKVWVWSMLIILILAVSIYIEPTIKNSIKEVLSIDLDTSPNGFFIFGATSNLMIKPNKSSARSKKGDI